MESKAQYKFCIQYPWGHQESCGRFGGGVNAWSDHLSTYEDFRFKVAGREY